MSINLPVLLTRSSVTESRDSLRILRSVFYCNICIRRLERRLHTRSMKPRGDSALAKIRERFASIGRENARKLHERIAFCYRHGHRSRRVDLSIRSTVLSGSSSQQRWFVLTPARWRVFISGRIAVASSDDGTGTAADRYVRLIYAIRFACCWFERAIRRSSNC